MHGQWGGIRGGALRSLFITGALVVVGYIMSDAEGDATELKNSRKAVHHFELTLADSSLDKLHVFVALTPFCNGLIVAKEFHDNGTYHYHCYLETLTKCRIVDVAEFGDRSCWSWKA